MNEFRSRARLAPAVIAGLLLAACSGSTSLPGAVEVALPATTAAATPTFATCNDAEKQLDPTRSFAPSGPLPTPGTMPDGSTMDKILTRGRLIVGVSGDTLLFGARNPLTGAIEGFDIDILKEVAKAIFGPDGGEKIEYRVINYAQRLPRLEAGDVDIVAHTMTINCNRWKRIDFSAIYFEAGQKVLVKKGSGVVSIDDLTAGGKIVCAPEGSTNIDEVSKPKYVDNGLKVVGQPDITDCLVGMQQGRYDAATGDDTVLAGFAAQDPNTEVIGDQFTKEPYGLGIAKGQEDFVRFVNGVLEQIRSNGRWAEIYQTELLDTGGLKGAVPSPPQPVYDRPES